VSTFSISTDLLVGSHVSFSKKGLLNAAQEAHSYRATAFMIYTGAPQNTVRKPMAEQFIEEGWAYMRQAGLRYFLVHAPYIVNLATPKEEGFAFTVRFLQEEIGRTHEARTDLIVVHPGAAVGQTEDEALKRIAAGLREVLRVPYPVRVALETMSGQGSEVGRTFEQLRFLLDEVGDPRLAICFDTCHVFAAGYDISRDLDGVLETFDRVLGLERLACVHVNDSKFPLGSRRDRHAVLGTGYLGFAAPYRVVHHPALAGRSFILETPWVGTKGKERPMYEAEIALLAGWARRRFGEEFVRDVEALRRFFAEQGISSLRSFVLEGWEAVRAKKTKVEPFDDLYVRVREAGMFPALDEEHVRHRIVGALAVDELGEEVLAE